ncbi:hypothetical protein ACKKBF_B34125 [Auxenochlorella protothecoides x Auxenochlorella symbiontica]
MFPCPTFSPPPVDLLGPAPNRFLDIILLENELSQQLKHVGDWRRDLTPLGAVALPHPADSPLPPHDTGEDEVDVEEVDNMAVPDTSVDGVESDDGFETGSAGFEFVGSFHQA